MLQELTVPRRWPLLRSGGGPRAWLVAAVLAQGCAHESPPPPGPVVRELELEGANQVKARVLAKEIVTTETGCCWPFAKRHHFDPFTWQSDLRRVERSYRARGFYQAKVTADEVKPVDDGVELVMHIREGEPTTVDSVRFEGLDALAPGERDEALDDLGLEGVFREDRWEKAQATLATRLRELGYARAEVRGRALVDVRTRLASLLVTVDLGPRCTFGEIRVDPGPAPRIVPLWIWEQVRLAIPEGERYSEGALAEAQRRVVGMGVFAMVKIGAGDPDPESRRVPVLVETREAPLRLLRAGGGVKIDQVRNEGRAIFEWSHLDFLGGMRRLAFRGEGGYAFIPNAYAVARGTQGVGARSGPIARLRLELEQPRLLAAPRLRGLARVELERTLEQAYDALGGKASAGISWQPFSSLALHARHHVQGAYLNGPAIASASAAPLTLGCAVSSPSCFIWLSYLEPSLAWDRRDSPLEPRRGYLANLAFQIGGGPFGGNFTYLRVLSELRGYLSFGEEDTLTLGARVRFGQLLSRGGESAVVTRFFAGGGVSMRGFSDRRLSPLLLAPPPSTQVGTAALLTLPIGGDGMLEASVELRWLVTSRLGLVVFVDAGQVSRGTFTASDLASTLWAAGFGFRYHTAIGPIRIDFARRLLVGRPPPLYAIDATTGSISRLPYTVNDSCFGLGGSGGATHVGDGLCVFHIAIGEAF